MRWVGRVLLVALCGAGAYGGAVIHSQAGRIAQLQAQVIQARAQSDHATLMRLQDGLNNGGDNTPGLLVEMQNVDGSLSQEITRTNARITCIESHGIFVAQGC